MIERITPAWLRGVDACYSDEEIAEDWRRLRWPVNGVEPLRLARARSIPVADRVWVLCRDGVLTSEERLGFACRCVDRAVGHAADALDRAGVDHGLRDLPKASADTLGQIRQAIYTANAAADAAAANAYASDANDAAADAERKNQIRDLIAILKTHEEPKNDT